jgi:hypothetical protein
MIRKPDHFVSEEILNSPLEARCRRVKGGERGHFAAARIDGREARLSCRGLVQGAVHGVLIAPLAKEIQLSLPECLANRAPGRRFHTNARPAAVVRGTWKICEECFQHGWR